MSTVFSSLHESLQQVLSQRLGWTDLREVQEKAYSAVARGSDVLVLAPTAGGKSEAALIPVIDDILKKGLTGVSCLYLSPLKALINDQEERFRAFCVPASLSVMKWHGDVPKGERSWKDEAPHFLMITPESLEVVLQEEELLFGLRQTRTVIIDELHAFVESERGVQLKVLLGRLDRLTGRKLQRIGLSATTGNPEEILSWLSDNRHGAELVTVPVPPREKQFLFVVEEDEDRRTDKLVEIAAGRKALVFVNSRSEAERIMQACKGRIQNLHAHHSSLSPETRRCAEEAFSSEESTCIVCTSTLELGIDIGDLDIVIQVGPPRSVSSFLQRMGRSGRRGKAPYIAWLLESPCEFLLSVAIIECAVEKDIEKLVPPVLPLNVLLQQILLTLNVRSRVTRRELAQSLLSSPAFASIRPGIFDEILSGLAGLDFLESDGDVLMPGPASEREFGRSNAKDLYSLIRGGGEYRAVTPEGEMVGMLDAGVVNRQNAGPVSLGGRGWSMVKCDDDHGIVVVVPSDSAGPGVFRTSGADTGFSPNICNRVRHIHARRGSVLPLNDRDRGFLAAALGKIPSGVGPDGIAGVERRGSRGHEVMLFTFRGSGFNRILAVLLERRLGGRTESRYNDFIVVIRGIGRDGAGERVMAQLAAIGRMGRQEIGENLPLPDREGWKFAHLLPDPLFQEMVIRDYYHIDRFLEELGGMKFALIGNCGIPTTEEMR